ncbi:hypothetical protein C2E23DRAFT_880070 [Lenzites betulinus]|nr:hypothetical protein C2E23DRAFT_880070 [Lenzites betulinus]
MEALLSLSSSVFHDLAATRYLSAVGLTVLLFDHLLTFADEVKYIWPAPATYAKYMFLLNRYTVLGTLIAVAYNMSGVAHDAFTNLGQVYRVYICKQFIFTCSMFAIVSVGIANLLILQRVVILWEHRPIILKIMTAGFLLSFTLQVVTMVLTLMNVLPSIQWSAPLGMCIATKSSHILIAVWASPAEGMTKDVLQLVFEMFVLTSTALNALDRPRTVELPIIKALHSDGLGFFLTITCFRVLNLVLAASARPSLTFLGVFFCWAMTTTVLNRLLLHLRRAECKPPTSSDAPEDPSDALAETELWDRRRSRAISPFGLIPIGGRRMSGASAHSAHSDPDSDYEAGHGYGHERMLSNGSDGLAPLPIVYHYRKREHNPNLRPWD